MLFGTDWVLLVAIACAVAVFAGMVKGVVGFAMPMVFISMLSNFVAPEVALAGLILPTLVTNLWQALRQGFGAALASMAKFRVFLLAGLFFMVGSAQLVTYLSEAVMLLMIGIPVTIYAALTLLGRALQLPPNPGKGTEIGIGSVAGFFGGGAQARTFCAQDQGCRHRWQVFENPVHRKLRLAVQADQK
ncbi:MAG: sulfite exporter TauE/SafE family protein, partial [Pseudomonadota bacterium]